MGLASLLKKLMESGSGIGNALARRYMPAQFHRTKTDEGVEFMKSQADVMGQYAGRSMDELNSMLQNKVTKGQKLIDDIQNADPRFPINQKVAGQKFTEINQEIEELERLSKYLKGQAELVENLADATKIMDQANRFEKGAALIKSSLLTLPVFAGGMYYGASSEDANPDFYNPEKTPFNYKKDLLPPEEPDEAVDKMMEKNFGEKTANVLMDFLSPIPRYVNKDNGRK